jgi:hypothetical protein
VLLQQRQKLRVKTHSLVMRFLVLDVLDNHRDIAQLLLQSQKGGKEKARRWQLDSSTFRMPKSELETPADSSDSVPFTQSVLCEGHAPNCDS